MHDPASPHLARMCKSPKDIRKAKLGTKSSKGDYRIHFYIYRILDTFAVRYSSDLLILKMVRLGFYIIINATIGSFLLSCGTEERDLFPLGPDIQEWASFKEGSFWIFQNDSTGMLDSLFVGYNGTEIYPSADGTHDVETVNTTITNNDNELLGFIFALGIKDVAFEDTGSEVEYSCAAGFTLQDGQVKEENVGKGYFVWSVSRMDDKVVNNIDYQDVIKIEANRLDEDRNIIENISNIYWISKNNWIIKKIYTEGNTTYSWSLLRSNIIQ